MAMNLNGKNYHDMIVTAEEKLVIDAMRAGGRVDVNFHRSTIEKALAHLNEVPKDVLPYRSTRDLNGNSISFEMGTEFLGDVSIIHFLDTKKH